MPEKTIIPPFNLGQGVIIEIRVGADSSSLPKTDGLDQRDYTHVDLHLSKNGDPIMPSDVTLDTYDIYFLNPGYAETVSIHVADAFIAAARHTLGPAPEPVASEAAEAVGDETDTKDVAA